jgi:hypothetical protein
MTERTIAQLQADWVAHGTLAKLQAQLDREPDTEKRKVLEESLAAQRKRLAGA